MQTFKHTYNAMTYIYNKWTKWQNKHRRPSNG